MTSLYKFPRERDRESRDTNNLTPPLPISHCLALLQWICTLVQLMHKWQMLQAFIHTWDQMGIKLDNYPTIFLANFWMDVPQSAHQVDNGNIVHVKKLIHRRHARVLNYWTELLFCLLLSGWAGPLPIKGTVPEVIRFSYFFLKLC